MLKIIGGTYLEKCHEPYSEELYGSGLRAAVGLSTLQPDIEFYTYFPDNEQERLDLYCSQFQINLKRTPSDSVVIFQYEHPFATPSIFPNVLTLNSDNVGINVEGEAILQYSMLEGSAVVSGKRVVYDPQSPHNPKSFQSNGSTAEELSIVLNFHEARALVGEESEEEICKKILDNQNCQVAVIKKGSQGATVVTETDTTQIPAYITKGVWTIGSGDIFAALYAYHWAVKKMEPIEAASAASLATAFYCSRKSVHAIPTKLPDSFTPVPTGTTTKSPKNVYLAGPFFDMGQRWVVNQFRDALLQQNLQVFSPFHDVGLGDADDVVEKDIIALEKADMVVAILNGKDTGTIFEIGYAIKRDIPVIIFAQNVSEEDLKMCVGTGCKIYDDFSSVIYHVAWMIQQE